MNGQYFYRRIFNTKCENPYEQLNANWLSQSDYTNSKREQARKAKLLYYCSCFFADTSTLLTRYVEFDMLPFALRRSIRREINFFWLLHILCCAIRLVFYNKTKIIRDGTTSFLYLKNSACCTNCRCLCSFFECDLLIAIFCYFVLKTFSLRAKMLAHD